MLKRNTILSFNIKLLSGAVMKWFTLNMSTEDEQIFFFLSVKVLSEKILVIILVEYNTLIQTIHVCTSLTWVLWVIQCLISANSICNSVLSQLWKCFLKYIFISLAFYVTKSNLFLQDQSQAWPNNALPIYGFDKTLLSLFILSPPKTNNPPTPQILSWWPRAFSSFLSLKNRDCDLLIASF